MQEIKPFHQLLHGILRSVLWNRINKFEPFNRTSTIPAHMLGRDGFYDVFSMRNLNFSYSQVACGLKIGNSIEISFCHSAISISMIRSKCWTGLVLIWWKRQMIFIVHWICRQWHQNSGKIPFSKRIQIFAIAMAPQRICSNQMITGCFETSIAKWRTAKLIQIKFTLKIQ